MVLAFDLPAIRTVMASLVVWHVSVKFQMGLLLAAAYRVQVAPLALHIHAALAAYPIRVELLPASFLEYVEVEVVLTVVLVAVHWLEMDCGASRWVAVEAQEVERR